MIVGQVGSSLQGNEHVPLARIHHLHIGTIVLDQLSESQCHTQVYVLLLGEGTDCTGVMSAVSGIYHQRKPVFGLVGQSQRGTPCQQHNQHKTFQYSAHSNSIGENRGGRTAPRDELRSKVSARFDNMKKTSQFFHPHTCTQPALPGSTPIIYMGAPSRLTAYSCTLRSRHSGG